MIEFTAPKELEHWDRVDKCSAHLVVYWRKLNACLCIMGQHDATYGEVGPLYDAGRGVISSAQSICRARQEA